MAGRPPIPLWVKASPFFLSGLCFLSVVFTVVSPLPILFLAAGTSQMNLVLWAVVSNFLVVSLSGGISSGFGYFVMSGSIAAMLSYALVEKRFSLERSVALAVGASLAAILVLFMFFWVSSGGDPKKVIEPQLTAWVNEVMMIYEKGQVDIKMTAAELRQMVIEQSPSAFAISTLVIAWANAILFLRMNPFRIREKLKFPARFLREWRTPEVIVWPTIVVGASALFSEGVWAVASVNLLKFFFALYVIQGLAIYSFLLDTLKLKGFLRVLAYFLAVWPFTPLLLGLGFFDLWFDFRSKMRQSYDPSR